MSELAFDDGWMDGLLAKLVSIPSVFPEEEAIMLFLERTLAELGMPTERLPVADWRFNLLSRFGSGHPVFCLNAHADTVPPAGESVSKARAEAGIMYGLGTADDKGSVVAMVAAVKAIRDSGIALRGTLDLLISVDEEGDARGVRSAVSQGYRCDMAVTGEPTELDIVPVHCGLVFLDIVTYGKSTHGAIPMEGVNAVDRMFELVSDLRAEVTDIPAHPLVGPPTLNLGIIHGGDRPNRVPDRCEASVDIRLVPPMTVEQVLKRIEGCFAAWRGKAEYIVTKQGGPLDTPYDSRLVRALRDSAAKVLGREPPIASWRGWTEAESFQSRLGVDAVVFGPGALARAHSADEFVDLEEVRQAARVYAETALSLLTDSDHLSLVTKSSCRDRRSRK